LPSNKLCLLLSNKLCLFLPRSVFAQVVINEFLPNPVGGAPEDGEFIELYNTGAGPVEISGWALDDIESGGTSPYIIPSVTVLGAGSFLAFYKSTTFR
jgi:hypothetical protein